MRLKKGLTLIELLVVVVILGAIAAIAVPRFYQASEDAKEKACETNCDTISTQIEAYFMENESYPADISVIINDPNRFPDGPPTCPKDGSYYIDSQHRAACTHSGGGPGC